MTVERQLSLQAKALTPSAEWQPRPQGWLLLRVAEGQAYWLQNGAAVLSIAAGEVLLRPVGAEGVLRASQLGPVQVQYFLVQIELLNGILTLAESSFFATAAKPPANVARLFPATEPVSQQFTGLVRQIGLDDLAMRCACLQLWAMAVAGLAPELGLEPAKDDKLRERFRQLVGQIAPAELLGRSLADLAAEVHCSERHFSRLFREEFGKSLRARQIEMRLQRAREILTNSNAKIIHVAYESGYRHLGLFNAMFKKRFGMTPSECRRQALDKAFKPRPRSTRPAGRRLVSRLGLGLLLAGLHGLWLAQGHAGETPKAVAAPVATAATNAAPAKPRSFPVSHYAVEGNTILSKAAISAVFTNVPESFGTNVTFEQIRVAMTALQRAYRERGYVSVSVTLPPQKITNATVKVKVVEGNLVAIKVTGNRWYSEENVRRAIPSLHTNVFLNNIVFQRELDIANASRDRTIYPVIGPGPEPGTSELTLKVTDQFPMHARVELNNANTPGTPDLRVNSSAQYDNLWDREHQVGLQYSFSVNQYKASNPFLSNPFGSANPFDLPEIANYSAYYRIPLGGYVSVQQLIDQNPSSFGYNEVTHQFNLPKATGRPEVNFYTSRSTTDTGITLSPIQSETGDTSGVLYIGHQTGEENTTLNEALGFKFTLPLPPADNVNSSLSFGMDYKHYELRSASADIFYEKNTTYNGNDTNSPIYYGKVVLTLQSPIRRQIVDYLPLNASWSGSVLDHLGTTFFNAQANANVLPVLSNNQEFGVAAYSTNAHAHYVTVQMGADRIQRVYRDWDIKLHADGQWASEPLFSNEQFGIGGTAGVRGYFDGQDYGDAGWRMSVEPRTPSVNFGMVDGDQPFWCRGSVFVDYGETYRLDAASSYNNHDFLGTGFGLSANIGSHWDARFTLAWPLLNNNDNTPVGQVHVYFGVGAQF